MTKEMTFRDSKEAFENAIEKGILSDKMFIKRGKRNLIYAGDYMYMYSVAEERKDFFKHIDTRKYISSKY
jgi:hypothetical protein